MIPKPAPKRSHQVLALLVALIAVIVGTSAKRVSTSPATDSVVSMVPARLLETRSGPGKVTIDGAYQGIGKTQAGSVIELPIAGRAGVPSSGVTTAVLNITAILPDDQGYLTVFPCGSPRPLTSNVNYQPGDITPNAVFAKLGVGGKICIYTLAAVHIVADINAYIVSEDSLASVVPARILETRSGPQHLTVDGQSQGIGRVAAYSTIELTVAGRGGVPRDVAAVVLNLTAVRPKADGYLTVFPCGTARPTASNVNYRPGDVVPNAVVAKVGAGGKVCVYTLADTDIVADVNGYVPKGSSVWPIVPARLLETRSGAENTTIDGDYQGIGRIPAGSVLEITVTGRAGVPTIGVTAALLNVTAIFPDNHGYLTVFPCGSPRPLTSNVNYQPGDITPNAVLAKVGVDGKVCIYTLTGVDIVADVNAYVTSNGASATTTTTSTTSTTTTSTSTSTSTTTTSTTLPPSPSDPEIWTAWVSSPNAQERRLLQLQESTSLATVAAVVDLGDVRDRWLGVGAALTDSSVTLLEQQPNAVPLLFDSSLNEGAHLNLVRLPLSATDFSTEWWTWEWDPLTLSAIPTPQAEAALSVLTSVTEVRPDVEVVGTPWTAPVEMKSSGTLAGGALAPGSETAYGQLLLGQTEWFADQGVPLAALAIANEPGHSGNYPTMLVSDQQMIDIALEIGPTLAQSGVELWAVDHNWEDRGRVDTVLAGAPGQFDRAAFHCYVGAPAEMGSLAIPSIVTECTGQNDTWENTFRWDARNLVVDSISAGSTGLMMWNLALDPNSGPKRPGGCEDCRPVLTIDPETGALDPTPEFYTLAHLARAADPGAAIVGVISTETVPMVAFLNEDGTIGIFGHNNTTATQVVSIRTINESEHRFEVRPNELFTMRGRPESLQRDAEAHGRILESVGGERFYVDTYGIRHSIVDGPTLACHGGSGNTIANVPEPRIIRLAEGEPARCRDVVEGGILRTASGTAFVAQSGPSGGLLRSRLRSNGDAVCQQANGHQIRTSASYHIYELATATPQSGGLCILTDAADSMYYINSLGRRESVPDLPTRACLGRRGYAATAVSASFALDLPDDGLHYCFEPSLFRGRVLRHTDGDAYYIDSSDSKTWIPDGPTWSCRLNSGVEVVETVVRKYVDRFPGSEWDYCYDINTLKGRIISHPAGDSHYVDLSGVRHWIPTTAVYQCLVATGIPAESIRWREYILNTPEGAHATCGP